MLPKIHKKGTSFKGAAQYLLHDKGRAATSERVAWNQAHNLAVNDPHMAWRIMAATALDRHRLKEQAGIPRTGNKSEKCVLHLSIGWREDEAKGLKDDDMKLAAERAIKALGAQDHQSLVIAHTDTKHPHVHILINRVNMNDGRLLSSSNEKSKLQALALAYEKERGQIYCEQRLLNAEARKRGEYTRYKSLDRRMYEEISQHIIVANDNRDWIEQARTAQKKVDAALCQKGRDLNQQYKSSWQTLRDEVKTEKSSIDDWRLKTTTRMVEDIRETYRLKWRELHRNHVQHRQEFEVREVQLLGRVRNATELVSSSLNRGAGLGELFTALSTKGARLRLLERTQQKDKQELHQKQKNQERYIADRVKDASHLKLNQQRLNFLAKADQLRKDHEAKKQSLKQQWRDRHKERRQDWHNLSQKLALKEKARTEFTSAANGLTSAKDSARERIRQKLRDDKDKGRDGR